MTQPRDFTQLPDLAARALGGSVIWANDESFAEKENLIRSGVPGHSPATFGHKGQVYDGWETRRRRAPGSDHAIIRLGTPGIIHGVIVDTSWFVGNYPPEVSVEGTNVAGYPDPNTINDAAEWETLVPQTRVDGNLPNKFDVSNRARFTHVRLSMHPDGGVARLRVHGYAKPDPALLAAGPLDLAAVENGAYVTDCSNFFYSSPNNLLMPGFARSMGDGWETARRRFGSESWEAHNDWVEVKLAAPGTISMVELDTTCFLYNSPGSGRVQGRNGSGAWHEILPQTPLRPDTRHRFPVVASEQVTDVRLDIYPDGGMSRLRVWGQLTAEGHRVLQGGDE
ncbi:allantoicase [Hoyosella rhizosphaerae]|uniref:Probable allantoicase n=1 Tax=Hoyosella rhizosphaerae TaxID=1755582 RepID=A0A916XD33_9ACTN|nr:allantoicase [Hoyosella rhizosphaerae]GGC62957.1 putative allantoicase [Hoyosella rhizosphaerae]